MIDDYSIEIKIAIFQSFWKEDRQIVSLSGTGSPEPSVTKDEGHGTPGSESPVSISANP